jgi:NADH:ubiquinone oxidoreductase subunit F (NADH-binding)
MTALLDPPSVPPVTVPIGYVGAPRLLGTPDLLDLGAHLAAHGPLPEFDRSALLALLDAVNLTGRGGAAFPLATKVRALRPDADPVVVVNGAEGEPASAKDRALLGRAQHLVLDGAQLLAAAVGARRCLVAISDPALAGPLHRTLAGRPGFGQSSRPGRSDPAGRFELHRVPDRFVAGEARALIAALNGGRAAPPGRRVLPTDRGIHGQPTLLCNAETLAQLAILARLGPAGFAAVGTPIEPGSTLLTVSGAVRSPGVLEVPLGTRLGTVAAAVGALPSQAVVVGGYHGSWLAPDPLLELSRAGLAAAGGTLGAGVLIFVGEQTCPLAELARVAGWLAGQSVRQCGPCTFGLPALAGELTRLVAGRGEVANAVRIAGLVPGRGACAHPDGAARFVRSGLAALAGELRTHRAYGGCRRTDQGQLATARRVWS